MQNSQLQVLETKLETLQRNLDFIKDQQNQILEILRKTQENSQLNQLNTLRKDLLEIKESLKKIAYVTGVINEQ